MLWFVGSFFLAIWVVEKFIRHKGGGFVPMLLIAAAGCFIVQFAQDRRTRAYKSGRDL